MGMVGGGRGAFIGAVHRMAAGIDGQIELVCGALHVDPDEAVLSGQDLYLKPERIYRTYNEMFKSGIFGKIRKVVVEYPQGWLSTPLEKTVHQQATWRKDPI